MLNVIRDLKLWSLMFILAASAASGQVMTNSNAQRPIPVPEAAQYVRFYSPTSFWNTPLPADPPLDPNSAAMVQASLVRFKSHVSLANDAWGMSLAYAHSTDKVYTVRSEEHTSELQSLRHLVCRLL